MDDKKDASRSRGSRLARRAKSFKDDFLGKLNQIRSPSGTRAGSPSKGSKNKVKPAIPALFQETVNFCTDKEMESVLHSSRLLSSALRYFQDVVQKNTLEMLPGSATVVLETVLAIHTSLRESLLNEQSSITLSATNQVYQSLANLIRWSDSVLLYGDQVVEKENIFGIVEAVRDSVKALIQLSLDKLQNKDQKSSPSTCAPNGACVAVKCDSPHRNSLPDIPLTPREREILEQTQFSGRQANRSQMHHSASSDSILGSGCMTVEHKCPPPKPPLPQFREVNVTQSSPRSLNHDSSFQLEVAPPLPPKKKTSLISQFCHEQEDFSLTLDTSLINECNSFVGNGPVSHLSERTSPFGHSPENSTPLSKSSASSMDSNLDYSADDSLIFGEHKLSCRSYTQYNLENNFSSNSSQTHSCNFFYSNTSTMESYVTSRSACSDDVLENVGLLIKKLNHVSSNNDATQDSSDVTANYPPALPTKLRSTKNRILSQYDNVPQLLVPDLEDLQNYSESDHNPQCPHSQNSKNWVSGTHAPSCPHHQFLDMQEENGKPPPLPPKKKTIMAYMQMFGSYSQPSEAEFFQHSLHTYKVVQAKWQQMELSFMQQHSLSSNFSTYSHDSGLSDEFSLNNGPEKNVSVENNCCSAPPALPPKKSRESSFNTNLFEAAESDSKFSPCIQSVNSTTRSSLPLNRDGKSVLASNANEESCNMLDQCALDELDASQLIIYKTPGEDGPDIRGGTVDSLIVHATKATKNDFLYQEAFLTTFRTFISPSELVKKLLYRYNKFIHMSDLRQRAARNAFALLVRVVDDMCFADIQEESLKVLMDFIFQLLSQGELVLARALRKKVVEKCEARQKSAISSPILLPSMAVTVHQASLLDFKSENLAEQMTVLDANLFQKIEIPEVLLWAKEQKEELSPNLTTFTEHFNKMSYWARSRILEQEDARERERYVIKFIKIMKYLRKLNNFNSYLAILSALDSAPIRRLEWQRNITEGLNEYCALIDSSSSFRAYRQALAETGPPCIPYIGLILQDLTFVHIGNSDWFPDGSVNFSKRWQQFNILDSMRRFKNCQYPFKKNEAIIAFFNNFDDYLCEEAMWQISETIKPRGNKKKVDEQS